ncbi:TetR/AcrR family transcriptional regulator C-terminal domain-containing protein [Streptomyces sp. NPDC005336]|uniref:TetR/AcrR family transcriptional regulator C-terminal domain-containing protein n=1 Tax=Streptomyces sp. NPDC005336 TaxID=3157035 RepID=UPI0033BE4DE6
MAVGADEEEAAARPVAVADVVVLVEEVGVRAADSVRPYGARAPQEALEGVELRIVGGKSRAVDGQHREVRATEGVEMATAMYRDMARRLAVTEGVTWQERLMEVQRGLRRTLLGYRDGAKVFSGTRFTDTGHAETMDAHLRVLVDAGFTPSVAARASFIVYSFTLGFVVEEQAVEPMEGERARGYDLEKRAERIGADYPLAAAAGADLFLDFEERFEEGLRAVVAGIEATLGPASG